MKTKKTYKTPRMKVYKVCAKSALMLASGGDVIVE